MTWELDVNLSAPDFAALKNLAKKVMEDILSASTYKDLPTAGGGGGGGLGSVSYSVTCKSPVEHRIAALRAEADELERGTTKQA